MRKYVDLEAENGGFPLPPDGGPIRVLASHHDACQGDTRLRLPRAVPPRAVRRVVCQRCAQAYEPERVTEVDQRAGRIWRWLSLPAAAVAVAAGLLLIQGDEGAPPAGGPAPAPAPESAARQGKPPKDARLVSGSTFQLALPEGWRRTAPSGGATFAAAAPGGEADATLWVERDPKLDFASFEARSLAQLKSLAGSAGVVERNPGPTPETTSITIAPTSAPDGAPNYEVLLRASGNHWYYLATTSQPGASAEAIAGVKLIRGSFLPQGAAR